MKRGRRAPAKPVRRPSGPPARRSTAALWAALTLGALAATVAVYWLAGRRPTAPEPPPAPPLLAGAIEDLYRRGRELLDEKRAAEALPLLRQAMQARPDLWQTHQSYAVALLNTSYDSRLHQGFPASVTRSSLERVAAAGEAIAELETAQRMAPTPRDLARARRLRAQLMGAWGFPWDAFVLYRQAQADDPSWTEPAALGDQIMVLMRDIRRTPPPGLEAGGADASP